MRRRDEHLTPAAADELAAIDAALAGEPVAADHAEAAVLTALLVAERPRASEAFAAELDARVAERFAPRAAGAAQTGTTARGGAAWLDVLRRPFFSATAATLAVALVALVVVLSSGNGTVSSIDGSLPQQSTSSGGGTIQGSTPNGANLRDFDAPATGMAESAPDGAGDTAASAGQGNGSSRRAAAPSVADKQAAGALATPGSAGSRKVVHSASIELGAAQDDVDDVAQDVLATTARFGGIVDQSSIASGDGVGGAQFALRIPSARLQPALAALSRLPDSHVLARSDDQVDVNQAYVSIRRRLANARAERAGVVRALAAADTEDETLRLRYRLDELERTIAQAERAQRGLDRRIDFSTVSLTVRSDEGSGGGAAPFTVGRAFHDAVRVLEVAAGVAVIAAAALVPLALLLACIWPLTRALRRRQREQALDAA